MLNILNLDGSPKKSSKLKNPQLTGDKLLKMYDVMVQVRVLNGKGMRLQRQGKIGFHIPTLGQEAHIGAIAALDNEDWIYPAYREHGAALYRGLDLQDIMHHMFANENDFMTKGRRLPGLFGDKSIKFVNPSAPIGTQIVQAAGTGYASKYKHDGAASIVFFGDGATSSTDFHSGLNFAGVLKAPTIFMCMNNQYAISVPLSKQTANTNLVDKAKGYGMPGIQVDGNDILAMYAVVKEAAERARNGEGPTFIEAITYRLGPHTSSDDPTRYRSAEEVEKAEKKDPILRFKNYLMNKGLLTEEMDKEMWDKYDTLCNEYIENADGKNAPAIESMFEDIYEGELPWNLKEQLMDVKKFHKEDN